MARHDKTKVGGCEWAPWIRSGSSLCKQAAKPPSTAEEGDCRVVGKPGLRCGGRFNLLSSIHLAGELGDDNSPEGAGHTDSAIGTRSASFGRRVARCRRVVTALIATKELTGADACYGHSSFVMK